MTSVASSHDISPKGTNRGARAIATPGFYVRCQFDTRGEREESQPHVSRVLSQLFRLSAPAPRIIFPDRRVRNIPEARERARVTFRACVRAFVPGNLCLSSSRSSRFIRKGESRLREIPGEKEKKKNENSILEDVSLK